MSAPGTFTNGRRLPTGTGRIAGALGALGAVGVAYSWELRKLAAQRRTWLGIAGAALIPVIFLVSIQVSKVTPHDGPYDTPLGPNLRHSGLALDLVVLTLVGYIGPAIVAALVASDIVAAEDMAGTLKTILVRSVGRGQILAAKTLALFTYVMTAVAAYAVVGMTAGTIVWRAHPLTNLDGQRISSLNASGLTLATLTVYAVPVFAIASLGLLLSVVTRYSVAALVGTLFYVLALQGLSALPALDAIRPYILMSQLTSWKGFFRSPTDWGLILDGLWVSALYIPPPLVGAAIIFRRRDVTT